MPVPGIHNSLVLERTGFPIKPGMTRRQEFDFLECIKINDGSVSHNIYIFELFYQLSKAMAKQTTTIPIASIILDEEIYPRDRIDQKRVGIFAENIRDGFKFDPIEVEPAPGKPGIYRLGIPQDRLAKRLNVPQQTISRHLPKMPGLAKWVNSDLSKGFTVPQVAQKHGWPEPLVWSQALVNKDDFSRFKALITPATIYVKAVIPAKAGIQNGSGCRIKSGMTVDMFNCRSNNWGLRTWDLWNWNDCDRRFGDDWPGRIPAQMIAHILYYFSDQDDLTQTGSDYL